MGGDVLSREASQALALRAYKAMTAVDGTPFLKYAERVAELTQFLTQRFVDYSLRNLKQHGGLYHAVENGWHIGLLHAVIRGADVTFEDVMDVANMDVAKHVASLTPDHRLVYPRRTQLLYNGLHGVENAVKLVKLAERTVCLLTWLSQVHKTSQTPSRAECSQLTNEMNLLVPLLAQIPADVVGKELAWCCAAIGILNECARKPALCAVKLGELRAHPIPIPATRWSEQRGGRKRPPR